MKYLRWLFSAVMLCSTTQLFSQQSQELKTSFALQRRLKVADRNDSITLVITSKSLTPILGSGTLRVLHIYQNTQSAVVRTKRNHVAALLQQSDLRFADVHRVPKEELTTGAWDPTLNKINLAHARHPAVNGETIVTSVKEQLLDSTDIDFKGRYIHTIVAAAQQTTHASIMATILAGGGNSSPYAKGVAWGAYITSSSFESLFPDPDSVYRKYAISVQNHSYGTGIENFYGSDAAAYDLNVWNNPSLLHVFSAGNSGTATPPSGIYARLPTANLTGSFKMSKNSIAVGHVDSSNLVPALSSRGPAYDGRLKPELVAFGEDGSSGAAALVSGTAALVQHAYRLQHQALPSAALVKAVLLNSADDVDAAGVDYRSGFGSLNAGEALRTVAEKRYWEDTLRHGDLKKFGVVVPSNAAWLKVTIAWTDTAAEVNAHKALVNDLDLTLTSVATGDVWRPWILNMQANRDSLSAPARRGRDTLNNVEQITVTNLPPGLYTVTVQASSIKTAHQPFAIAYQIDTADSFSWTYPTVADGLIGRTNNRIRWQTNKPGRAEIQYSFDSVAWTPLATVDLSANFYVWQVPDTTQAIWLRMHFPSGANVPSDPFTITRLVSLKVGFHCDDSLLLYWNAVAPAYRLYTLGDKYLEPVLTTSDTLTVLNLRQQPTNYYSVAPLVAGKEGFRSSTINYGAQGVGCYFNSFLASLRNSAAVLMLQLGTVVGISEVVFEKWNGGRFQSFYTLQNPQAPFFDVRDDSLVQGVNLYRVLLKLNNGKQIYSGTEAVYYFPRNPVLFYPNPARRNEPVNMLVQESDFYTVQVMDAAGRLVHQQRLDDRLQRFPALRLSAGIYFIQIRSDEGRRYAQKLVVY